MISKLNKGDSIEVLAPSSYITDKESFLEGINILKNWGLRVNHNNTLSRKYGYLAGNDATRFSELQNAQDEKMIIFAKGGWGAARLLEKDPSWKEGWMLGFSDTCSLLLSKYSRGYLGSVHGPMLTTLSSEPPWSISRLKNLLFDGYVDDLQGKPLKKGLAHGKIIVSNLTIATFLIGTDHIPNLKGKIIVFEDVNEEIYKIDRMLTYWKLSKKLKGVAGIGFGNFSSKSENHTEEKFALKKLIYERLQDLQVPIIYDLPIGHISGNASIPIGFDAVMNGNTGRLSVLMTQK